MKTTKMMTTSAMLVSMALAIELIPIFWGEPSVIITVLSALPIYIIARMSPLYGIIGYMTASILLFLINPHQALFFTATNGIIGLTLGAVSYYSRWIFLITTVAACAMCVGIQFAFKIVGTPSIGILWHHNTFFRLSIHLGFSYIYCYIYNLFASTIYKKVERSINY